MTRLEGFVWGTVVGLAISVVAVLDVAVEEIVKGC
jgi:hypothetical protein